MPAQNVLFLVHGMGSNLEAAAEPTAWFKEVEKALHDGWKRFPSLAGESFADYIELCPLSYDQRFRQYTSRLADAGDELEAMIGTESYDKALAAIAGAGADDERNFLWANVMDVVLYRLGGDFNVEVQAVLMRQLAEKVKKVWAGPGGGAAVQFSMLSHSLGTAVAHGMLQRLALGPIGKSKVFTLDRKFTLGLYMTLANTSRVLFRPDGPIYDKTVIKPGGYVRSFINVRHVADPVPAPLRFAPATWGAGYREIVLKHCRGLNIHGFKHYRDHPEVTGALFLELVPFLLSEAEVKEVVASYPDVANDLAGKRAAIERLIADMARELHEAYDDETHLVPDTVELIAKVARQAWRNRKAIGALT